MCECTERIASLEDQVTYLMEHFRSHSHDRGAGAEVPPYWTPEERAAARRRERDRQPGVKW